MHIDIYDLCKRLHFDSLSLEYSATKYSNLIG